eukprot:gnl/Hemi2/25094_TR8447_c1_g1_i1.p1 gnl/Hemi2/25094_TR8447_c1_g1~~gnl/Hemi2/25094_TR8447_c1_g1_i1.p1  ORF type:complete len:251 (-),score=41.37 gnl/Hemi2/25094_TR8447_c1_g1_i1:126-878(-)
MAVFGNNRFLASGSRVSNGPSDGNLRVWDLLSGTCIKTLVGHQYSVNCLARLPSLADSAERLVSGGDDARLLVWDPAAEAPTSLRALQNSSCVRSVIPLPHVGPQIVACSDTATGVVVWDLEAGAQRLAAHSPSEVLSLGQVTSPTGRPLLCAGCKDGVIRFWDETSGENVESVKVKNMQAVCALWCGPGLAISGSSDNTIRVFDARNLQRGSCRDFSLPSRISCLTWHQQTASLLAGCGDGALYCFPFH